jgi:hypothetical protein
LAATLRSENTEYVGFSIDASVHYDPPFTACVVAVSKPNGGRVAFHELIDNVLRGESALRLPEDDDAFHAWLLTRAIGRARGAIALDMLDSLEGQRFMLDPKEAPREGDDREVETLLLGALRKVRRLDPQHMGYVPLDAAGVSLVEGIRYEDLDYSMNRLKDQGLIDHFAMGWDDHNWLTRITEEGLQALERSEQQQRVLAGARAVSAVLDGGASSVEASIMEYFVAHEFSLAQIDDLRSAVDGALSGSGLKPYYADSEVRQGHIFMDKILPMIKGTRFGIYEISNPERPNVFLELGAGLAFGKPCIIVCRGGTEIPADLEGLDRIEYHSYADLTAQLHEKLQPYVK